MPLPPAANAQESNAAFEVAPLAPVAGEARRRERTGGQAAALDQVVHRIDAAQRRCGVFGHAQRLEDSCRADDRGKQPIESREKQGGEETLEAMPGILPRRVGGKGQVRLAAVACAALPTKVESSDAAAKVDGCAQPGEQLHAERQATAKQEHCAIVEAEAKPAEKWKRVERFAAQPFE